MTHISTKRHLALIAFAAVFSPFFVVGFVGGCCWFNAAVGFQRSRKMAEKLLEGYQ